MSSAASIVSNDKSKQSGEVIFAQTLRKQNQLITSVVIQSALIFDYAADYLQPYSNC
jgi:hypothetical protein